MKVGIGSSLRLSVGSVIFGLLLGFMGVSLTGCASGDKEKKVDEMGDDAAGDSGKADKKKKKKKKKKGGDKDKDKDKDKGGGDGM